MPTVGRYVAAVDPSGGGADAFTLAIAHVEGERIVQDVMRGWAGSRAKPLELTAVTAEIVALCRRYRIHEVLGDRYGAEWVRQAFREAGLRYQESPWPKSEAYRELEPLLAVEQLELLDHPELQRELRCLERRYHPGGRIAIDHPAGLHDDHANALALAAALAVRSRPRDDERHRPEGSFDRYGPLGQALELDTVKAQARARGIADPEIAALEAEVGPERLPAYLRDLMEESTMRGRLRRAGLLDDEDEEDED